MATKKNKSRNQRHKVASFSALSAKEMLAKGNVFLSQEKYQDAILCFKQLLKEDESPEVLQALEQAYLGRIRGLAAKSMIKEALLLLTTVIERWPNTRVGPLKLSLLLQAGRFAEAAGLYGECQGELTSTSRQQLEALFGALLLSGTGDLRPQDLSEGSPVVRSYEAALSAMEAVFAGQEEKARNALQGIPFRSPYRDLRTLLTGLLHLQEDREKGKATLQKIEKGSPYWYLAARYLAISDSPETFLQNLATIPRQEQQQLRIQCGLDLDHFRVLEALSKSDGQALGLYHIIRRNENCFDKKTRIKLLKNILPFCKDEALDIVARSSDFHLVEKNRICALAAENDGATTFAIDFWDDYLGEVNLRDSTRHKEIAMVMRRQAKLKERDGYEYSDDDILTTLLKSLEYDPSHVETWLFTAEFAKRHFSSARYYSIINDALAKLPDNVVIMVAAMQAYGARGAHKKAARLAERILAIDPINTTVLDFLVESRLEHGRKLASQKKWLLAEKELQSADTRVKALRYRGRSKICLGMLSLLQGKEEGLLHIGAGREENGSPLLSHILTALEARLYKLKKSRIQAFDRELQQAALGAAATSNREFLRLINWLLSFKGDQYYQLRDVGRCLAEYFAKAVLHDWSKDEGLLICKALERGDLIPALVKFSAALFKKFPADLEFLVWSLLASSRKGKKTRARKVFDDIANLLDTLEKNGRHDFVDYIEGIIGKRREFGWPSSMDMEEIFDDIFGSDEGEPEDLFDDGPFKIPKKLHQESGKAKPQPKSKVQPNAYKQLNLFDDEE